MASPSSSHAEGRLTLRRVGVAAACALAMLVWQAATVHFNYGGDWTALFCTGEKLPPPRSLSSEKIFRFPGVYGYDGQFYHYIAHDPFLTGDGASGVDAPRLRYRRILVPLLAWCFSAGGRPGIIHAAYIATVLAFLFLGAYWLAGLAVFHGRSPLWGAAFAAVPAVLISIDRLTVDIALAAAVVGFVLSEADGCRPRLYASLTLAALARETGVLLAAAVMAAGLYEGRPRRALAAAAATVPALAWYGWVHLHTAAEGTGWFGIPLSGVVERMLQAPVQHRIWQPLAVMVSGLDYLALAGALLAFPIGLVEGWKRRRSAPGIALMLFACLGAVLSRTDVWQDVYGFPRTLTPLLLLPALAFFAGGGWRPALPLLMVTPRVAVQFGPQIRGILERLIA